MRNILVTSAAFLALTTVATAETRDLRNFTGVSASDRIEVEVAVGETYRVDVTGSDASRVTTRIDDGTLIIRRTNRPMWGGTPRIDATVHVTMPRVISLASSRGAELTAANVNTRNVELAAAMGGSLRVSGVCTNLDASASMGGSINAEALECQDADISVSMGGDARVFASNRYDVSAAMGGSANVAGGGQSGDISTTMGGSVATH
ncbi:MAG: DUF2807 domain-containing protein [Hyphomonadaceae bacterium]|nr:DUF2807 domain-containing protein [Hyphomonadaceae bacterium]